VILGEQTGGSTGQPYYHSFDNGMKFQLSTKREYLPDGSLFEGVGIAPDIEVHTSAADLRNGSDPVMVRSNMDKDAVLPEHNQDACDSRSSHHECSGPEKALHRAWARAIP
jgi:C-terminal processing protease CtpA/Prc